jgi:hypothetical protein
MSGQRKYIMENCYEMYQTLIKIRMTEIVTDIMSRPLQNI